MAVIAFGKKMAEQESDALRIASSGVRVADDRPVARRQPVERGDGSGDDHARG